MARRRRSIGEILLQWGLITDDQMEEALAVAKGSEKRLGETLVELGHVEETDVAKALASQFDMEYIDLNQPDAVSKEATRMISEELIKKFLVLPVSEENGRMKVILHDPMDLEVLDTLRFRLNKEIDTAIAAKSQIKDYIDNMMGETRDSIDNAISNMSVDLNQSSIDIRASSIDMDAKGDDDGMGAGAAPIVRLVNQIIADGVRGRASDIHIEPLADRVRLRYRIDGACHEQNPIPKRTQASVIARLKIMANGVRVEEKRIPQDGRIKLKIDGSVIDFRFSSCPAYHGESCVMRVLNPDAARIGLSNLGLRDDTLANFNKTIKKPNGIFLVTGPTGSGKTTSLYTALDVLNRPDKKIITAEDPVEYNFPGINQCQVKPEIGLTFPRVIKAMLRQAPNIILVGEIRDKEVADVAIEAALTGHLVFSTLHTNDAPSAITRLIDMGVKPFLVASSIQAVLAQRLVRVFCPNCKEPDPNPDKRYIRLCGFTDQELEGKTIMRGAGCNTCSGTGFKGRRGVYEYMAMNSELRDLAFKRSPVNQLRAAAKASGMRDLLGDGKLKILDGQTGPKEIAKIAQVEGTLGEEEDVPSSAETETEEIVSV